jgi:hypothetical protein
MRWLALLGALACGCGHEGSVDPVDPVGGSVEPTSATATGGDSSGGAATSAGGHPVTTGGASHRGGSLGVGGAVHTGGSEAAGGTAEEGAGGAPDVSAGGSSAGGAATGGSSAGGHSVVLGGASSGGSSASGHSVALGGASSSGGAAIGGFLGVGGATGTEEGGLPTDGGIADAAPDTHDAETMWDCHFNVHGADCACDPTGIAVTSLAACVGYFADCYITRGPLGINGCDCYYSNHQSTAQRVTSCPPP